MEGGLSLFMPVLFVCACTLVDGDSILFRYFDCRNARADSEGLQVHVGVDRWDAGRQQSGI